MIKFIVVTLVLAAAFFFFQHYNAGKNAPENIQLGEIFLAENAKENGVIGVESGMQYTVLKQGSGDMQPNADSNVTVHYHGMLMDGTVFDSSVEREQPISFNLQQVIPGWTEGVQFMVEGDKFRFYMPSKLAYGNRGAGKIPGGALLIFEIELIKINS